MSSAPFKVKDRVKAPNGRIAQVKKLTVHDEVCWHAYVQFEDDGEEYVSVCGDFSLVDDDST